MASVLSILLFTGVHEKCKSLKTSSEGLCRTFGGYHYNLDHASRPCCTGHMEALEHFRMHSGAIPFSSNYTSM